MTIVRKFHEAFDLPHPEIPSPQDHEVTRLRMRLIEEEFKEVMHELRELLYADDYGSYLATLGRLLKELCDLRYVVDGAAVVYGLPIEEAYLEVHASNMSKLGRDGLPIIRADGKVLKGQDYFPADMQKFVTVIENEGA